ncbi:hypothetical protein AB1N83_011800 [Pleurotus pulmonarius]
MTTLSPSVPIHSHILQNIYTFPHKFLQQELAAYLLGLAISSPLYAISICQVVRYFRTYRRDPRYLKATVHLLIAMESARFLCLTHTVYMSFATLGDVLHHVDRPVTCHENIVREITLIVSSFHSVLTHTSSPSTVAHSYAYVLRLFHLSNRNKLLVGTIMLPTLCQFASGLGAIAGVIFDATGAGLGLCSFSGPFETGSASFTLNMIYGVSQYSQLSTGLVSDVLITLSMFYYLRSGQKGTTFLGTRNIIAMLISYTLAIGLVTSIISIVGLVLFTVTAAQAHFPTLHFVISNVYINSFLASLNWRMGLREAGQGSDLLSTQGPLVFAREQMSRPSGQSNLESES